jgi:hypothetical protein
MIDDNGVVRRRKAKKHITMQWLMDKMKHNDPQNTAQISKDLET